MGKVYSALARPFKNFNIENRAIKYIEKQKLSLERRGEKDMTYLDLNYGSLRSQNPQLDNKINQLVIESKVLKKSILPDGVNYVASSNRRLPTVN